MGRVLITNKRNQVASYKCKSKKRAQEIAEKRPDTKEWKFYEDNEIIPRPKKKVKEQPRMPQNFEELDLLLTHQRSI